MVWKPNVTVASVLERKGRFLLVEEETEYGICYNQPAGHLECRESLIDAVIRLIPGVLGDETSSRYDSFSNSGLLEHPQYTRPREFRGMAVPEILLSGHHEAIAKWQQDQSLKRTAERRADLLDDMSHR